MLNIDLIYTGLSHQRIPFSIMRDFPSNEVAQGLIGKPTIQGYPNQVFFTLYIQLVSVFGLFSIIYLLTMPN